MAILYILVAVGFIADRTKLFTEKAARLCTDLMFYIITPAKIVQSFISMEFSRESATRLAIAAACGAAIHIIGVAVSSVVFNKSPIGKAAIFKYSSVYGNCGYMALPLAYAVLGDEGVFYGSVVIMMFHLFSFTHGIWLMSRSETGEKTKFNFKNILINPGTISLIIGLPLYLLKIRLPNVIEAPIDYLAALNTPVAMLIFGTYLSNAKIKSALKEWRILCVALIKLAVIPLICLGVFQTLRHHGSAADRNDNRGERTARKHNGRLCGEVQQRHWSCVPNGRNSQLHFDSDHAAAYRSCEYNVTNKKGAGKSGCS